MKKLLILSITFLSLLSCSPEDDQKIAGLFDFSGEFRVLVFRNPSEVSYSPCSNSLKEETYDLKINKDHTFEQKIYQKDNNNNCKLIETLKGKITITGSFYGAPNGEIEYFNSDRNYSISMNKTATGKHDSIYFSNDEEDNSYQIIYERII